MSYVRFGKDSDIYMYDSEAGIICQWCALVRETTVVGTHETALRHLDLHRSRGHLVPERAYENLRAEARGEDFENPYDDQILDEVIEETRKGGFHGI